MKRKKLQRRLDQAIAKLMLARFLADSRDNFDIIERLISKAIKRLTWR